MEKYIINSENQNIRIDKAVSILDKNISAPIEEGDVLGRVKYTINGVSYSTDLIASHNVEKSELATYILYSSMALIGILLAYRIFFYKKKIRN